jgi:hypothetical protein
MPRYWIRAVLEMAENGAGCYRLEQYDWLNKQVRRSRDVYSSKESAETAFHADLSSRKPVSWAEWQPMPAAE